ncbi:MAG: hypothetical protein ACFFAA_07000, partial [Promethearchaeota archaeon]
KFKTFELLIDASIDFNIFVDANRLTDRFNIISKLILNCVNKILTGYQTSALGEIIDILRLGNKYHLLEKEINEEEKKFLEKFINQNKQFLENLNDLFGKTSDSFVLYVCKVMPQNLYNYLLNSPISFFQDFDGFLDYVKNIFFDQYTVYGLNVRNLIPPKKNSINEEKITPLEYFFNELQQKQKENRDATKNFIEIKMIYEEIDNFEQGIEEKYEIEKIHLISPSNILKYKDKIFDKNNYNFYNLSMVVLGGLGPQGLGFTYSTPKGEVIEICSDRRESEAIIIKYKQYLKRKFLIKLEKELKNYGIDEKLKPRIVKFLSNVLNQKELINYYKKEKIIKRVKEFLEHIEDFQHDFKSELQELITKVSGAISIILRRIELKDQFITRINLVAENKIKPEDVAKLTSLKGKSHYDVLRERFFFQNIVNWF